MPAREMYDKTIDVTLRLADYGNVEENAGSMAALFGDSGFHSSGNVKED